MYIDNSKLKVHISLWLGSMFWLISIMIIVGGLTRLTDSGLSITKWQLFSGIFPPLNNDDWIMYFDLYKEIPEFNLQNYDYLFKLIYKLDYNIFSISAYTNNKYLGSYIFSNNNNNNNITATFKITPSINQDLYNLFILNNNKEEFYDLALIDSYKTSLFMNKLFRNIKENNNLDLLEESDNEEEFENINIDKYVDLEKNYLIECKYNNKFKKWIPINLSKNKLINKNNLQLILGKKKSYYNV